MVVRGNRKVKTEKKIQRHDDYVNSHDGKDNQPYFFCSGTVFAGNVVNKENCRIVGQVLGDEVYIIENIEENSDLPAGFSVQHKTDKVKHYCGKKRKHHQEIDFPQKAVGIGPLDIIECDKQDKESGGTQRIQESARHDDLALICGSFTHYTLISIIIMHESNL
jgi:hypothetical protein